MISLEKYLPKSLYNTFLMFLDKCLENKVVQNIEKEDCL